MLILVIRGEHELKADTDSMACVF